MVFKIISNGLDSHFEDHFREVGFQYFPADVIFVNLTLLQVMAKKILIFILNIPFTEREIILKALHWFTKYVYTLWQNLLFHLHFLYWYPFGNGVGPFKNLL